METVYVVGWEYDTGGGFDWYRTKAAADKAFETEKPIADELSPENWEVRQYEFEVSEELTDGQVTNEIDMICCELFEKAEKRYKGELK